jgi:phospholipase/carboxylesterase
MNDILTIRIRDWVIRYREVPGNGPHPVVWLFHGWMGDEDSMWVFASLLPEHFLVLAPRGIYPVKGGGYSWVPQSSNRWSSVEAFDPAISQLMDLMANWPVTAPWGNFECFRLAGFSQGAALAYAFTLRHPEVVQAVAGLAGFLPDGAHIFGDHPGFKGLPVYISHGNQDRLVPIAKAHEAAQLFDQAGAQVTFCESDVGHKLNADCFKGLEYFFQE